MYKGNVPYYLTPRENDILELIQKGYTNSLIAEELDISIPTVKTHVRNILGKLELKSRYEIKYLLNSDKNHTKNDV